MTVLARQINIHEREIQDMKQWKKLVMVLMCTGVLMSVTACGRDENADDNGAVNNASDDAGTSGTTGNGTTGNGTNDATNGNTGNNSTGNGTNEGVMDEIGDDIKDGAEDVGDALDGNDTNNNDRKDTDR